MRREWVLRSLYRTKALGRDDQENTDLYKTGIAWFAAMTAHSSAVGAINYLTPRVDGGDVGLAHLYVIKQIDLKAHADRFRRIGTPLCEVLDCIICADMTVKETAAKLLPGTNPKLGGERIKDRLQTALRTLQPFTAKLGTSLHD